MLVILATREAEATGQQIHGQSGLQGEFETIVGRLRGWLQAREMSHQVRTLVAKPDDNKFNFGDQYNQKEKAVL